MTMARATLLAPFAAAALAGCGLNSVPTAEEAVKARWADVQNQYERRASLIPNLVRTVQAYARQERTVLTEVTRARAQATAVTVNADQLGDPAAMRRYAEAQGALGQSLGRLLVASENYPELKSNANFLAFQSELEGTENRIAVARRDYNQAVQAYNTRIRTFPDAIGARIFHGAQPIAPFEATTPGAQTAPTVDFDPAG